MSTANDRPHDPFEEARATAVSDIGEAEKRLKTARAFCWQIRDGSLEWLAAASRDTFTEEHCGPDFRDPVGQMRVLIDALKSDEEQSSTDWPTELDKIKSLTEDLAQNSRLAASHEMTPFMQHVYNALDAIILAVTARDQLGRLEFNQAIVTLRQVSVDFSKQPSFPRLKVG
jgi:hypothetical protein